MIENLILKNNRFLEEDFTKRDYNFDLAYPPEPFDTNNKKIGTELDPSIFRSPPCESSENYRVSSLASFAVLGIDIKITPEGEVKIIEVNGINSGMKGFGSAGIKHDTVKYPTVDELKDKIGFELENEELWRHIKEGLELESHNPCDEALRRHIDGLGKAPVAYIAARLAVAGKSFNRMKGADSALKASSSLDFNGNNFIFNDAWQRQPLLLGDIHYGWYADYGELAQTVIGIEKNLEDKVRTDRLFEGQRHIKPRSLEYTSENFEKLAEGNSEYLIIKPNDGARGDGIRIVKATAPEDQRPTYSPSMIIEPFVPSKPIHSSKDNQDHDGCMRYVVFVEEDKKGNVELYHFGGYWRLAPNPLSDELDIDALRANMAQGAIPERVAEEDLDLVRDTLNRDLPEFYRKLVDNSNPIDYINNLKENRILWC